MSQHRVEYHALAVHLRSLPLSATCNDLVNSLYTFLAYDPEYRIRMAAAIMGDPELAPDTEWLKGLDRLCQILKEDNPRFDSGLFMEWVLEEK